jgi:hypothetical protein
LATFYAGTSKSEMKNGDRQLDRRCPKSRQKREWSGLFDHLVEVRTTGSPPDCGRPSQTSNVET